MADRRTVRRGPALLAAPVVVGAVLLTAAPAAASCAEVTPASLLDGGEVVLATAAEVDGHRAVLAVEEVWSGPDRAPRFRVTTGETSPSTGSSGDVELARGERYLLALRGSRTDACSVLVVGDGDAGGVDVTTAQLDAARPADVRGPVEGADAGGEGPVVPIAAAGAGGALAAVLAGALVVAVRRRPRADGAPQGLR